MVSKHPEVRSPAEPAIWFICSMTMTEVPIQMRLDDRLDKFGLVICNFGLKSARPFIAAGEKGKKLSILHEGDAPLDRHRVIHIFWVRPPTLREFFKAFQIEPKQRVIVEFRSGHKNERAVFNDIFWWKVNVSG